LHPNVSLQNHHAQTQKRLEFNLKALKSS